MTSIILITSEGWILLSLRCSVAASQPCSDCESQHVSQLQNGLLALLLAITVKLHPLEGFWSPSSMLAVLIWHGNLKCTVPWWDCNWPLEIEASSIRVKKTHPFCWCPLSPLHWLQPQISTLHQPQPSEGAVASSHFLGFLSVTPPSAYLLHQAVDQGIDEHFAIMKL